MDKETTAKLTNLFYGKQFLGQNLDKFIKKVREAGISATRQQIKEFYEAQETVQRFRPYHKEQPKEFQGKIVSTYPFEKFYVDTMFLNKYGFLLVNGIDLFSKYGFSKLFRYKRGKGGESNNITIDSTKTAEAIYEFQLKVRQLGYDIKTVAHDSGSEFSGVFEMYLNENNIKNIITDVGDKKQTAPIERFNYSIRLLIEKYKEIYGGNVSNSIQELVELYNTSLHSSIKTTPAEVLQSESVQNELAKKNAKIKSLNVPNNLKVGDTVRVYIKKEDDPFNKLSPNWSKDIYVINSYNAKNGKYTLNNDKKYTENKLQLISSVMKFDKPKTEIIREKKYAEYPATTYMGTRSRNTVGKNP